MLSQPVQLSQGGRKRERERAVVVVVVVVVVVIVAMPEVTVVDDKAREEDGVGERPV